MVTSPLLLAPDPQTIDFLKACDNFYSKMNRERKYKGKDNDKDNDRGTLFQLHQGVTACHQQDLDQGESTFAVCHTVCV